MRKLFILATAFILLWIVLSAVNYYAWVHGADHRDFYPRWAGARLAILEGRDLYADETTRLIQMELYGRELPAGSDQQGFAYPAQLLVVLFPFWLVGNVEFATALWEGLSVILLGAGLYLLRGAGKGGLPFWGIAALILWYFPLLMIFQGQVTALPLIALAAGYYLYRQRRDWAAGLVICLGVIKPELVLLPYLALLVLAVRGRRWKLLGGFALGQAALFLASLLLAGWWLPGWLAALRRYAGYAQSSFAPRTAWETAPLFLVLIAAFLALVLWRTRWSEQSAFAAAVPLGMLLLPQTLMYGLTMLLVPMALSWQGRARWAVGVIWLLGWSALFWPVTSWRWQNLLFPMLALGAVALASHESAAETTGPVKLSVTDYSHLPRL